MAVPRTSLLPAAGHVSELHTMYMHRLYDLAVASPRPLPAPRIGGSANLTITEHQQRRISAKPVNRFGYTHDILTDGSMHVSWSDLFDFVVSADGSRIDVHAEATWHHEPVYTYLLSQVISVALLAQEIESLHGSAVAFGQQAFVMLGDCGNGKSTLTAALIQSGAKLLTDDLVVLRDSGSSIDVAPGAFRLKLDPATASSLDLSWPAVPMEDGSGKHVYAVDVANCATTRTPVKTIVLLQRGEKIAVNSIEQAEAVREILAATFNPLRTDARRLQRLLFAAQSISSRIPIVRLQVPHSFKQINNVVQTVRSLL